MAPVGVIEAPRIQLENGLVHTKNKPTSLPAASPTISELRRQKVSSRAGRPQAGVELERNWPGQRLDLDVVAEALDFGDETFDLVWFGAALEVIGAEVMIECAVCDHVVGGG